MRTVLLVIGVAIAGCTSAVQRPAGNPGQVPAIIAPWSDQPVTVDGRLDEPVWQTAEAYVLRVPADRGDAPVDRIPAEGGTVRFAHDERFLYIAFDLIDRDIVQENDQDQQDHFNSGDVAEVFLKPQAAEHYWEFYVTPQGRRTAYFFPGRGRAGLASNLKYQARIRVAAQVQGELNEWSGVDQGWTAEIAVPLDELAAAGVPLDDQHPWIMLAGRYNYGAQVSTIGAEISSYPGLSQGRFHRYEQWAPLHLSTRP